MSPLKKTDEKHSELVLRLYTLITAYQMTEGDAQQSVQNDISALLRGYTQDEVLKLKDEVMVLAAQALTGSVVVMVETNNPPHGYSSTQARKQIRENFLKEKVASLASNMSKADLMKVVRAYHAPEQREIAFYCRPDEKTSQFFGFRGATFAMHYATEEEFRRGKSPVSLDHVSGELNLGRKKKLTTSDSLEP